MSLNLDLVKAVRRAVADDERAKDIDPCTVDSSFQGKGINHLWSADGIDGVTYCEPPVAASCVDMDCACNRSYLSREQQRYDCHVYAKGLDRDSAAKDIGRELSGIDEDHKWLDWFFETHGDEFYSAWMEFSTADNKHGSSFFNLTRLLLDDSDWVNKRAKHSSDYILPFLNLHSFEATVDQTETMSRFLDLVINRVKYLPQDFFLTDLEQTELGWQTGLVDVTFNASCVIIRGRAHGTLCDYKKSQVHGGYSMGAPRYMVGLRGQRRLYGHIRRMLQGMVRPDPNMIEPDNTQGQSFIQQHSSSRLQCPLSFPDVDRHSSPPPTAKSLTSWRYDIILRKQSGSRALLRLRTDPDHVLSRIEYLATQLADAPYITDEWDHLTSALWSADHRRFVVFNGAIAQLDCVREAAKSLITEPCRTTTIAYDAALDCMIGIIDGSLQDLCVGSSSELAKHLVYYREDKFEGRNEFVKEMKGIDDEVLAQRGCGLDRMPGFLDTLASDGIDRPEWLQPTDVLSVCAETLTRSSLCKVPEPIPEILKDMAVLCQLAVSVRTLSPRLVDARRDSLLESHLSFADPDEDGGLDEMRQLHPWNFPSALASSRCLEYFYASCCDRSDLESSTEARTRLDAFWTSLQATSPSTLTDSSGDTSEYLGSSWRYDNGSDESEIHPSLRSDNAVAGPKHRNNVEPTPVSPVQRNGYQLLASGWTVNVILVSKSQATFWKLFDGRS
ncbi:hypothetical protein LTR95_004549 [Oleoguttula sp. CCFEE 5521]